MRKLKQTLVMLLAALMLLGTVTTAMAADALKTTGTVTIENAVAGVTYKLYRVFDISNIAAGGEKSSFITNEKWNTAIRGLNLGFGDFSGEEVGAAVTPRNTFADESNAQTFAVAVVKAANEATPAITPDEEKTVTTSGTFPISGLQYGFYVMVSSRAVGENETSQYTVFTLNKATLAIREKNTNTPAIKKLVKVEDDAQYVEAVSADFNATLNYQITVTAAAGTDEYTITDTLPAQIDYVDGTLKIQKVSGNTTTDLDSSDYTVTEVNRVITIKIDAEVRALLQDGDKLVITYDGKLNPNESTLTAYHNNATLTYEETKHLSDPADVFSGYISFYKKDGDTKTDLEEAKFVLTKTVGEETYYAVLTAVTNTNNVYYFEKWVKDENEATTITTTGDTTHPHIIHGLAAGTYTLVETEAPDGYIKGADTNVTITENKTKDILTGLTAGTATIYNTPGSELPSTGGIGTTIFYIAGALLVVSAVTLLIVKRRKQA